MTVFNGKVARPASVSEAACPAARTGTTVFGRTPEMPEPSAYLIALATDEHRERDRGFRLDFAVIEDEAVLLRKQAADALRRMDVEPANFMKEDLDIERRGRTHSSSLKNNGSSSKTTEFVGRSVTS